MGPWLISDRSYHTRDIYDTCAHAGNLEVHRSHARTEINGILKKKKKEKTRLN